MSSEKVGLALLGAGIFALEAHVPAILKSPLLDLKALYSRSARTVTSASLDPKLANLKLDTYYGDDGLEELLKRDDIQAVIIALPITKQPAIIEQCWKAGKHVLSEKPIGKDVKAAKDLIEIYESQYKSKGISWRVAENWAHEPASLELSRLIDSGKSPLGPVLFYDLKSLGHVPSGSKYHATEWRNVPDYQGGFLLDGGVHPVAMLRVALGDLAPTHITSLAQLHRTHLGPHDSFTAIASSPSLTHAPYGEDFPQPDLPLGQSSPTGTLLFSMSTNNTGAPLGTNYIFGLLNASILVSRNATQWIVEVLSKDEKVNEFAGKSAQKGGQYFEIVGVDVEVQEFAEAVLGKSEGKPNLAEPRDALWDVSVIQAALTSEGKALELAAL